MQISTVYFSFNSLNNQSYIFTITKYSFLYIYIKYNHMIWSVILLGLSLVETYKGQFLDYT